MVILVTGGAGSLGRRLAIELVARGDTVRILCLPGDSAAKELAQRGIEVGFGDVTRMESLHPVLRRVDVVFHLAAVLVSPNGLPQIFQAVNSEGTRNVAIAAATAGVQHLIYISSISVQYPVSNAYAQSKLQGEAWVRSSRLKNFTIVRPCLAYAEGGGEEFNRFVAHVRRGPIILLPKGGRALKSPVHIDDLVKGFLAMPLNPKSFGKTYHLAGGDTVNLKQMANLLLAHMGRPKPIWGVPDWICRLAVTLFSSWYQATGTSNPFTWQTYTGLVQDAAPFDASARVDLNYRPRKFSEGVATLTSLRNCLGGEKPTMIKSQVMVP